jgi:hypothetical protein
MKSPDDQAIDPGKVDPRRRQPFHLRPGLG